MKDYIDKVRMGIPLERQTKILLLDTREYCVDVDKGEVSKLAANVIEESIYAAFDDDGNEYLMMDSIVEYQKKNKAVTITDHKVFHIGWNYMQRSTAVWQLCVQWRDFLTSRKSLRDLKESHPVETAEYAVDQ